jgi:transcriptional regulator with XRE-family HTH domain
MRSEKSTHSVVHRAFGRAARETRARRGFSQEELGVHSALNRNVGAIERGEINPTLRVILKLTRGLDVQPSELMVLAEDHLALMANAARSMSTAGEQQRRAAELTHSSCGASSRR